MTGERRRTQGRPAGGGDKPRPRKADAQPEWTPDRGVLTERGREAERAVVGGIILHGVAALEQVEAAGLHEDHFGIPQYRAVFVAQRMLRERGEEIDVVSLEAQLRRTGELELVNGIVGLSQLDRYATAHNITVHAEIVREASIARELATSCGTMYERLVDPEFGGFPFDELLPRFKADVARIAESGGMRSPLLSAREVGQRFLDDWDAKNEGREASATLGFPLLDEVVVPTRGALIGVLAKSGHGKTALLCSLATALQFDLSGRSHAPPNLEVQTPVLIASAEMLGTQVHGRMAASIGRIEGRLITRPKNEPPPVRVRLERAVSILDDSLIEYMSDDDATHFDRIVTAIRSFAAKHENPAVVPVVFIDYLQLLTINGHYDKNVDKYDFALTTLAKLAKALGIVIVLLMQVVKSAPDRLTMKDVREAGTAENHCKIILGIYRPWMTRLQEDRTRMEDEWRRLRTQEELLGRDGRVLAREDAERLERLTADIGEAYVDSLKARDGSLGSAVRFVFEGQYTSFREVALAT